MGTSIKQWIYHTISWYIYIIYTVYNIYIYIYIIYLNTKQQAMCSSIFWPDRRPHCSGSKGVKRLVSTHSYSRAVIGSDSPILGEFQRHRQCNRDFREFCACLAIHKHIRSGHFLYRQSVSLCLILIHFMYQTKWRWFHSLTSRRNVN